MRTIQEVLEGGEVARYVHPQWAADFPWLAQGTTGAADGFDLRLFGAAPSDDVLRRWEALAKALGFEGVVHARQVHGSTVLAHASPHPQGLLLVGEADGHATPAAGLLLTVSVADCVPVSIVDPTHRAVALVHAGWRGVAAGVLAAGIGALRASVGADPADLHVHAGPSICGRCYEVGPEVHLALGLPETREPAPVDLARALAGQAREIGVPDRHMTRSVHCTRCSPDLFYSHRAGASGRQVGFLGVAAVS